MAGVFVNLFILLFTVQSYFHYCQGTSLIIVHNGDMHAKFEEYNEFNQNIGGFGRVLTALKRFRREANKKNVPILYLNSGDTFAGSLWYFVHRWEIVANFMKLLKPDVISLGTHEFDETITNLSMYIKTVGCPVVCANADFSDEPELSSRIKRSHIINLKGLKIGIIGYITPKTKKIVNTGNIRFTAEIPAIKKEARRLKEKKVQVVIALGHSGYDMDVEIAEKVKEVDLIVGGFSHTLLWKGKQPFTDVPVETYPKVVYAHQKNILIVHAGADTKYLGNIELRISKHGGIEKFSAAPVFLAQKIPQDVAALKLMNTYKPKVDSFKEKVIAKTSVYLSSNCLRHECNFGNMVTDAFIDYIAARKLPNQTAWSETGIAIINGGAIKLSIPRGPITNEQVYKALPFHGRLISFSIRGADLITFLEMAVRAELYPMSGQFFQVSGLHIILDPGIRVGNRIIYANARCVECSIPKLLGVVKTRKYRIVTTDYVLSGNHGNSFLNSKATDRVLEKISDYEVVVNYLIYRKSVRPEVSERFVYEQKR